MKTLNTYINEWKATDKSFKHIKLKTYFVYNQSVMNYDSPIKIFNNFWKQFNNYKDKVYDIYGHNVELDTSGYTKNYYSFGEHKFYIEDIDYITDCSTMFSDCVQLIKVPLFDTNKVINMYHMFNNCYSLEEVPLFNTVNVELMNAMFQGCHKLVEIPFFDTHNVTNISYMCFECKKIKRVPKFDTTNVKKMNHMFCWDENLRDVPLLNIDKVENMNHMFSNCNNLSEKTKKEWSQIYDFEKDDKKI